MVTEFQPLKSKVIAAIAIAAAALTMGACSSPNEASAGGTKMGVTIANSTNPFYVKETETVKNAGKAAGIEVISLVADEDVQKQSDQIDQLVISQVKFIVIDPVDSDGVGPSVKRAIDAGIPVIGIDSKTKNASVSITTNNVQAGEISCKALFDKLGGKGNIAIIDGTPIEAVSDRVVGCKNTLKDYPNIKVVAEQRGDNSRDKALTVATDVLTANPNLDGIFAINDPTASGVELAAKQKGVEVLISSVDGAQSVMDSIKGGGMIIATAAQDPAALAQQGVEIGQKLAAGEKVEQDHIELPTKLIDASNAAEYVPWG